MDPETLTPDFVESPYDKLTRLKRENENLRRQAELKKAYGLHFYRPHWKQHLFHKCLATGRYGRTGNRFGKSEMGIAETIAHCLGGRPWYEKEFDILNGKREVMVHHEGGPSHPLVRSGISLHPVKALLLVVDWDKAKEVFTNRTNDPKTCGKLFKLLPHESTGKIHLSRGGHIEMVEIKRPEKWGGGVSTLKIDTIEAWKHNKMGGESGDFDIIHVDEPIPEAMFKSYARGLMDRAGRYWFTCTPLDQMWINDEFTPPGRNTVGDQDDGLTFDKGAGVSRFIVTGSIYDNPHRNDAGVAEFESTLTREEKACRLYGMPLALAGTVYKEFIYDLHVLCDMPLDDLGNPWRSYHLPPTNYTVRVAWDVHGARVPQAILFIATSPDGTAFVYDELFPEGKLIGEVCEMIKLKVKGYSVADWLCDPRAFIINPVSGIADIHNEFMEHDLYFQPGSKDKTLGINATKEKLLERQIARPELPTLFFSPHLKQTFFEFSHYVYDLEKNEPVDKDDHMMENLRRLILNGLDYIPPSSDLSFKSRRRTTIDSFEVSRDEFGSNPFRL